jgi:tetratricopeptide (TPR) repeat protein
MLEKKIQKLSSYFEKQNFIKLKSEAEKIIRKEPNCAAALQYVGIALIMMRRYDEALTYLDKAIKITPNDGPILDTFSNLYFEKCDYQIALDYQLKSLEIDRSNYNGLEKLGDIYSAVGNPVKAVLAYKEAYLKGNGSEQMLFRLVTLLRDNGRFDEAQDYLMLTDHNNPASQFEQIKLYIYCGEVELGIRAATKLLETQQDLRKELVEVFQALGEIAKSREVASQIINDDLPHSAFKAISFGLVEQDWLDRYVIMYSDKKIDKSQLVNYYFALASYFKLKDRNKWFQYLKKGNQAKLDLATKPYNLPEELDCFDRIITSHRGSNLRPSSITSDAPIFVVGMPRSGTTLVETIIGNHSKCTFLGESLTLNYSLKKVQGKSLFEGLNGITSYVDDLEQLDITKIANEYLRLNKSRLKGVSHFVDKMPHNFLHIGIIVKAFPNAKIIHCRRNPIDTCLSIFEQNFHTFHNYGSSLDTLIPYYKKYIELMSYWRDTLPNGSFYDIEYEELTKNPDDEVNSLLKFCHLPFENQCLEFEKQKRTVVTASLEQVRKGIYTSSQQRWLGLEQHIKPLLDAFDEYI